MSLATEGTLASLSEFKFPPLSSFWWVIESLIHILQQLFDNLYGMLYEEHLFVQTVEDFHLNTCPSVKDSAMQIRLFIEKHLPIVQESKVYILF